MLDHTKLEALRKEALQDVEEHAKKSRFDLFTQPPPLCIGDSNYQSKRRPVDPVTKQTIFEPRGIYSTVPKKGQLPSTYLDGSFLVMPKGKEANPYVDPTKLKMGLVNSSGVSLAETKKKQAKDGEDKKPFFPAINKWNLYTGVDPKSKQTFKRTGAPYEYVDHHENPKGSKLKRDEASSLRD